MAEIFRANSWDPRTFSGLLHTGNRWSSCQVAHGAAYQDEQSDSLRLWIINIYNCQTCFYMQISPEVWTFWYLDFILTKTNHIFCQIKVFGKSIRFLLVYRTDFISFIIFGHFIMEAYYTNSELSKLQGRQQVESPAKRLRQKNISTG